MTHDERRKSVRISDEALALKVRIGDFDTIAHTLNLSASGLYCKVDREIPLMSRVKLVLMIPTTPKDAETLEVSGVVVRGHPVVIDGRTKHYDVAIFFDDLTAKDKGVIADYISRKAVKP